MKVLLTNDDGAEASGLKEFADALEETFGEVTIIVPELPRSGVGHSMSISDPLVVTECGERMLTTSGFPSDCVKYGLFRHYDEWPDLVVSGINKGENSGVSVFYSGTVGGAREGALNGITSFAVSVAVECDPASPAVITKAIEVLGMLLDRDVPTGSLLSINIPPGKPKGIKFAPQGRGRFLEELVERTGPDGGQSFMYEGSQDVTGETDTDTVLYRQGYVTVTPLCCDETDTDLLLALGDA